MKKQRDPGRGQLHKRGARVWRDEDNPTGPTHEHEEEEQPQEEGQPPSDTTAQPNVASPSNSGPGGGGATESAGRAKHQEGQHGGPTRKT